MNTLQIKRADSTVDTVTDFSSKRHKSAKDSKSGKANVGVNAIRKEKSEHIAKEHLICDMCGITKRGVPLWYIRKKFYCSYCGMVQLVNADSKEVQVGGYVGDVKSKVLESLATKKE